MPQYTGVVLESDDQQYLLSVFRVLYGHFAPAGFVNRNAQGSLLCHHMTCHMGGAKECDGPHLGSEVMLELDAWGVSDKALAFRVSAIDHQGVTCENSTPHITALVNPSAGGSPRHSNDINLWFNLEKPVVVTGVFKEV